MVFRLRPLRLLGWALLSSMLLNGAAYLTFVLNAYAAAAVAAASAVLALRSLVAEAFRPDREYLLLVDALESAELAGRIPEDVVSPTVHQRLTRALGSLGSRLRALNGKVARLEGIIEHAPTPLVEVLGDERIVPLNRAARSELALPVSTLAALDAAQPDLGRAMRRIRPSEPQLVRYRSESRIERWHLTAKKMTHDSVERHLIAMQNIDGALDATEFDAWRDLMRVVNHEIINALTPISSLAESVQTRAAAIEGAETLGEVTSTLATRARTLRDFILSYRELSRLPEPRLEQVELSGLVHELVALAATDLDLVIDARELWVMADPGQTEQAILNLIKNAVEAGGPVSVRVSGDANSASVAVEDSGPGVPEKVEDRLFVPFFTTKREGTGVGLSLVRQIALGHRGRVEWSNLPGGGARFELSLPREYAWPELPPR